jgi:putative peptidoglycan lipid II flippase
MTPLLATAKGFVVAIAAAVLLGHYFGATGIAAGLALGAWSNALSLIRHGAARFGFSIDAAARRRLPRIVAAAASMGALLWLAASLDGVGDVRGVVQGGLLLVLIGGAIAVYGLLLSALGVAGWRETVNALRQR